MKETLIDALKEAATNYHDQQYRIQREKFSPDHCLPIMLTILKTVDGWMALFSFFNQSSLLQGKKLEGQEVEELYLKIRNLQHIEKIDIKYPVEIERQEEIYREVKEIEENYLLNTGIERLTVRMKP